MIERRRFALLLHLFVARFFENDEVSPGGGFATNVYQILGLLVAVGWFVSYFLMPSFLQLSMAHDNAETHWSLHTLRMFFTSCSFAIVGFACVFEWDTLFPDRRDYLVLGPLPIPLSELACAKAVALQLFVFSLSAAVNAFPIAMLVLLSLLSPGVYGSAFSVVLAHVAATTAASVFALSLAVAGQGLLLLVSSPRWFDRVSPLAEMFGMSTMVLSLFLYPMYSLLLRRALEEGHVWPWLVPPVWFAGVYQSFDSTAASWPWALARHGFVVLAATLCVAVVAGLGGFRRHFLAALHSDVAPPLGNRWPLLESLSRTVEERAIFLFGWRTLARSRKHRLFLATCLSVGLSFGILFALAVRSGRLLLSEEGVRAFPFVLIFFAISGLRVVVQFPSALQANWIFRMLESRWSEAARRATRQFAIVVTLVPLLAVFFLMDLAVWGWSIIWIHFCFQFLVGALLIEVVFWRFDKIPFTCSYSAGRTQLALLAGLYLYGFTTYSFHLAAVERVLDERISLAVSTSLAGAGALCWLWSRRAEAVPVRFDAEEPVIQSLFPR